MKTFEVRYNSSKTFGQQYQHVEAACEWDAMTTIKEQAYAQEDFAFNFYVQEVPAL